MRKATHHLDGVDSLNPRRWRGKRLNHHGEGVCWLFVLLWMDSWCHELIVCEKWYKNNLKMRLTVLLFDPPRRVPHLHGFLNQLRIFNKTLGITIKIWIPTCCSKVPQRSVERGNHQAIFVWCDCNYLMWLDLNLHLGYNKHPDVGRYIFPTRKVQICQDLSQSESWLR